MKDPYETVQSFQHGLQAHIKPREQTNYIRRILALHVKSHLEDGPGKQPLQLADATYDIESLPRDLNGVYKEYAEALRANVDARRQFEDGAHANAERGQEANPRMDTQQFLDEHVAILKLRQKRQRLSVIQKYIDQFLEQPAASHDFLAKDRILAGVTPLPHVPKEIVNSLVAERSQQVVDSGDQTRNLEKTVLKAKLLLRHEERLLQDAKARSNDRPDVSSIAARLAALNTTRNALITWIEEELSLASTEDPKEELGVEPDSDSRIKARPNPSEINARLSDIKEKYSGYLACRKEIISQATKQITVSGAISLNHETAIQETKQAPPALKAYLLTPCIETLISFSNNQKSSIAQKAHTSTILSAQSSNACQMLGHLAKESQLIPAYPMKDSLRRRSGLMDALTTKKSDSPDMATRIKPWVFAADSAKIFHLESVAETIESGQITLESSIKGLDDIEMLLGLVDTNTQGPRVKGDADEDVWLDTDGPENKTRRKHTENGKLGPVKGDIWSILHGNLGTIGHEDMT